MGYTMQVKDQIRVRREALGITMHELGQRVGVTEQAVRHWESGRSYPSKAKTTLLEKALSFSIDWSEGANRGKASATAAAMIDPDDINLLVTICQLPLRAKQVIEELANIHLEAVRQARKQEDPPEKLAAELVASAASMTRVKKPANRK